MLEFFAIVVVIIQIIRIYLIIKSNKLVSERLYITKRIKRCFQLWYNNEKMGYKINDYMTLHNINTVAIYGMGYLGNAIYKYLKVNSAVEIVYVMDERKISGAINQLNFDDVLPMTDIIIVTPMKDYGKLENYFREKGANNIIPIEALMIDIANTEGNA